LRGLREIREPAVRFRDGRNQEPYRGTHATRGDVELIRGAEQRLFDG